MLAIDARACGIEHKRVLCAVSGGADSVALLRLLCECRDRGELELYAAHFEHGIRGEASVRDMLFVKAVFPGVFKYPGEDPDSIFQRRGEFVFRG